MQTQRTSLCLQLEPGNTTKPHAGAVWWVHTLSCDILSHFFLRMAQQAGKPGNNAQLCSAGFKVIFASLVVPQWSFLSVFMMRNFHKMPVELFTEVDMNSGTQSYFMG